MADLKAQKPVIINSVGLSKEFRDFWNRPKARAVNDIDFQVYEGEIVGLLGPNGSGKSTTVKMLLGLLYPTAGNLTIFGRSPRDVKTKEQIGYLPEESYLYKYLTALETLDFFGSLFNLSAAERRSRSEQLLEMVGLSHARKRPVGEFSKGMARRIGLAQAMINDPSLLILDEPTSGLDPLGCKEVKDLIMLLKKRGKTVVVTSHLLSDVEDVCDRVIILYGGKIRATGTLNELLTIPEESRITTPLLKPEITEKVLKILRENLKDENFSIDHPRKNLEEFFLEVINKAKADSVETAGVVSGGRIADYLTHPSDSKSVLEELTRAPEPVQELKEEVLEKAPEVKMEKIQELVTEEAPEIKIQEQEEKPEPEKDLNEVNKKLSQLLSDTNNDSQ
ncbi:MAG: ABC transporter ATP-binding protein [Lentisphaerae bacterium GWF2_44_16]|nr:MAG: ABC transporter ATP-binding protein [Lentisphaerae bacterium GWF2_44_16]